MSDYLSQGIDWARAFLAKVFNMSNFKTIEPALVQGAALGLHIAEAVSPGNAGAINMGLRVLDGVHGISTAVIDESNAGASTGTMSVTAMAHAMTVAGNELAARNHPAAQGFQIAGAELLKVLPAIQSFGASTPASPAPVVPPAAQ